MSGAVNPLDYMPTAPANPLASVAGVPAPDPMDFTSRYNTRLSPEDEAKFQSWASRAGRQNDLYDYDLRGAWLSDAKAAANGHLPDTWKKPNHPTFSDQSQYHGVDGYRGGSWGGGQNGQPWSFTAGPTNLTMQSPAGLQRYFQTAEPDAALVIPQ